MPVNPLDAFGDHERALLEILLGPSGLMAAGRRVLRSSIEQAIKVGTAAPVYSSPEWRRAVSALTKELEAWNYETLAEAFTSGGQEMPLRAQKAMALRIGELAQEYGGRRAVALSRKLDKQTSAGLRELIGQAANRYAQSPGKKILDALVSKVKGQIGITAKQAKQIGRWEKAARKLGTMSDRDIAAVVRRKSEAALEFRARAIARRGIEESVGWGRHQMWLEAKDAGLLPEGVMKQWRDKQDSRVRASHKAQTAQGPVPLEEPYPIQKVMHPPSRDEGCRCFEELVMP